jgi:phage-related protein
MVNGILKSLGPVGDVLDWVLTQAASAADRLYREAVLAIRYVKKSIDEVLEWAAAKTAAVFEGIVKAIEAAGIALTEVFRWAAAAGDAALELLGEVTQRLKNSISYVLTWIATDAIDGLRAVVKGLLKAGAAVADLIGWAVTRAVQIVKEVVTELLAAGVTIAQLVSDTIRHPQHALDNLAKAMRELGKTVGEIVDSAFIQPTRDAQKKVIQALKNIGEGLLDVLKGLAEAVVGAIDVALGVILEVFGVFRKLRTEEKDDAKLVYKATVPLNDVQIFEGSFVSGMSDWFRDEAVAVTTMRIIHLPDNFDTTTKANRHTLIHELGHVWQGENTGPYYMGHSLFSQGTQGQAAYDYGGTSALTANTTAGGKLDNFNPEQQAQIMADYFQAKKDGTTTTPYDPYIAEVQAA